MAVAALTAPAPAMAAGEGYALAFTCAGADDDEGICVSAGESGIRRLDSDAVRYADQVGGDSDPSWSPDGRSLAYVRTVGGGAEQSVVREIFVMGADGTDARQLTFEGNYVTAPDWSPDGTRIAFEIGHQVAVAEVATGEVTRLGEGDAPAWSPDGTTIAFSRIRQDFVYCYPGADDRCTRAPQIYLMRADGQEVRPLTEDPTRLYGAPAWSPDGAGVYARCTDRLCRIAGGSVDEVTDAVGANFPAPLPDGRLVFGTLRRGEPRHIFERSADGTVTADLGPGSHPDVLPNACDICSAATPMGELAAAGTLRRLVVKRLGVRVRITCRPAGSACSGEIRLVARDRRGCGTRRYATRRVQLGAGESRRIRLRLAARARRLVRARGRLAACLVAPAKTSRTVLVRG